MAKPDMPNFSIGARIVFGLMAIVVIVALMASMDSLTQLHWTPNDNKPQGTR